MLFGGKKKDDGSAEGIMDGVEKLFEDSWKLDWEKIKSECERAIAVDPNCYGAYIYLGSYEQQMGNYEKMDEYFFKGLELSGSPLDGYTWDSVITTLHDGMHDYERLVKYMKKAIEKEPDNIDIRRYLVDILWKKLGRIDEALEIVNEFLRIHSNDKKALKLQHKLMKAR